MKEKAQREETGGARQGGTGGQNLQEKETTLRYRLEMATFKRTGAGGVAGEDGSRVVELLSQKEDDVRRGWWRR